jgi:spore maturation protein CgeB
VDEEIFFPVDTEKEFDVILTGVPSEPRLKALDELKGLDIAIFGQWENCWDKYPRFKELYRGCAQTLEELNMLYNKSKVCIDVSTPQNLNSANFTVFNAMASGSVLVTNYKPALEELFGDSKPPFFKGSCRKIVEKYVNDPLLAAEESARQGKTVKEKHTFLERAKLVLKYMADTPPLSLPPELARQFREFCEKKT